MKELITPELREELRDYTKSRTHINELGRVFEKVFSKTLPKKQGGTTISKIVLGKEL
jgi:hypothetical protein